MLIEDNDGDRYLMKKRIHDVMSDVRITEIENGEIAFQYFAGLRHNPDRERPDLIFLDLNMPKVNGLEVLKGLKSDRDLHTIPIVIFSSSEAPRDIHWTYYEQGNAYVVKPVTLEKYYSSIDEICNYWFGIACLPIK